MTLGAFELALSIVGNYILETMLTVDMETGEQFRISVGLQTDEA